MPYGLRRIFSACGTIVVTALRGIQSKGGSAQQVTLEATEMDAHFTPRPNGKGSIEGTNVRCSSYLQDRVAFSMSIGILDKTDAPIG